VASRTRGTLDVPPDQLALFDLPAGTLDVAPEPAPRRSTATAGRTREAARAEYERLMRAGGYGGNAEALVGRCTTLAVESGIDYHRHLQNLDAADRYPAAQVAFNERRGNGRRLLTPRTIRTWWDRDTAPGHTAPLWHSADTLTSLSELREAAACYPWPASIEYVAVRRDRGTDSRRPIRERVAGDTARRVYLAIVAHAIGTGSVTNYTSVRMVADAAQVSPSAADRALRALTHLRLLAPASSRGRETRKTASRYRVVADPDMLRGHSRDNGFTCPLGLSPVVPQMTATFTASIATHPAFRSGTGLRHDVWHAVLVADGSATVPQLVTDLSTQDSPRNPRTMRRQVAALERAGLLDRLDDGTLRARLDHAALDAAATRTGAADRAVRQAARHDRERAEHERAGMMQAARANGLHVRGEAVTGTAIVVDPATGETLPLTEWHDRHRHPRTDPPEQPATGRARRHLRVVA